MAEKKNKKTPEKKADAPSNAPVVAVNAQYLKDLSFESPKAPASLVQKQGAPKVEINLNLEAKDLGEDNFEVTIHVNAKSTVEKEAVFIVDVSYAGLFTIKNVPDEHKEPVLLVHCPTIIFPFMRRIIADVTRDGGFPPLMIDPVDFNALFLQRKQQPTNA
jgi:protein-export chaperone SecB